MDQWIDTMVGRDGELTRATGFVLGGASVDVVGGRGSGRSEFLSTLRHRLDEIGWTVLSIRGVASLRTRPLGVLQLSGKLGATDGRTLNAIPAAADALRTLARSPQTVLLVDDWDDLDEVTWGVVEVVRRTTGIPVVVSRLDSRKARHTPTGIDASTLETAFVIELGPLAFDDLETAVQNRLGGPVEVGTMSRIYATSGGLVGLALNLVDAGVRERRLCTADGVWAAVAGLWSPSLRGIMEAHLENLDDAARDALEVIALVGVADVDTVRKLVDWSTLEMLEERALVRILSSGARQLVTVTPPLLVEFFRHEPLAARRIRLTEFITERLGNASAVTEIISTIHPVCTAKRGDDALLARLAHERNRTRRLVARSQWESEGSPGAAVDYVDALLASGSPMDEVDEVLSEVPTPGGDALDRARHAVIRANWTAFAEGDVRGALDLLRRSAAEVGDYAPLTVAAEVAIRTRMEAVPANVDDLLEVCDEHPIEAKVALWETQLLVLVSRGRFSDALAVYERLSQCRESRPSAQASGLSALALLGQGDYEAALEGSMRGVELSHGALDMDAARAYGAVAALCLTLAGDYQPADKLLESLLTAGDPSPFPPGIPMMLSNIGSVIATRRGDTEVGERLAREARERAPFGPLPGQSSAWPEAQLLSSAGRLREAADLMWAAADELWKRGATFSAAMGRLASVEIHHDDERLRIAVESASRLGGGLLLSHAEYLQARATEDPERMMAVVEPLRASGRHGVAVNALRHAEQWFMDRGEKVQVPDLHQTAEGNEDVHGLQSLDTLRSATGSTALTDRELEVSHLVARGLSNTEIAARLVLSVRTIENHVHRIMRKLDLTNRRELKAWIERPNVP